MNDINKNVESWPFIWQVEHMRRLRFCFQKRRCHKIAVLNDNMENR